MHFASPAANTSAQVSVCYDQLFEVDKGFVVRLINPRDNNLVRGALAISELQGMLDLTVDDGDHNDAVCTKFEEIMVWIGILIDKIKMLQK
ncbi:hypothetical protein O9G_001745 [Rozella allomycis CSF55]|uniref:Uncharacterized protein n=1 Tax=Rozella allomycis (strain CSF55) TaxID=988480 RepID=A0A075AST9_ROZAC|nr:hypothetical protein O9G_001745 [Rozella allomycis CSF55]|eukprot:EPZ33333.1 hypothetical protein O9G_001745 [Rozella allomycis CSF55]